MEGRSVLATKVGVDVELDATEAKLLAAIAERRGVQVGEVVGEAVNRFVTEALCLVREKA